MNLSDNLKKIRKDNNLSQEALAEKLNVSRQSVSKWESGLAYPEMDKVLQICKMFDLNIDELLNQNIKEVKNTKQSTLNVNKYIDDFLSYITKTIDLFGSMKFKQKIKCLFEQAILIVIFIILAHIVGLVLGSLVNSLLNILPSNVHYNVFYIFRDIYYVAAFILGCVVILHIFKVRYLDYYIVLDKEESVNEEKEDNKTKSFERKEEKVIIRDPKHSGYKFISALLKCVLFFVKAFTLFIGLLFCISLISFVVLFVLSFLIAKTGLLFWGLLCGIVSLIIVNLIILDMIYNFIVNKKCKKGLLAISFLLALVMGGVGIGFVLTGLKDFKVIDSYDGKYIVREEKVLELDKDDFIDEFYIYNGEYYYGNTIEYIESNGKEVKLVLEHANYCEVITDYSSNGISNYLSCNNDKNVFKGVINNLNDKVFVNPDYLKIYVYASKENINKLKQNKINHYNNY